MVCRQTAMGLTIWAVRKFPKRATAGAGGPINRPRDSKSRKVVHSPGQQDGTQRPRSSAADQYASQEKQIRRPSQRSGWLETPMACSYWANGSCGLLPSLR